MYSDAAVSESMDWNTYRMDVTHQGVAPPDCTVDAGLIPEWRDHSAKQGRVFCLKELTRGG